MKGKIKMKNTLFAIGEALIDFIPDKKGCDFSDVTAFSPKIGGAPANVLGAFSKLGGKTQLITQLGNDPFGHKILKKFSEFNIGTKYISLTSKANTALAFVSLDKSGDRTFSFYRNPSADMLFDGKSLEKEDFSDCYALHFCSVSLGDFPMKEAHKKAIELAKSQNALISFDFNLRFPLWESREALKKAIFEFLPFADFIKVSEEELEFVTGTADIEVGCKKLLEYASLVVCTCGEKGAYAYAKDKKAFAPSQKVTAVDTTGAGDAFCGSFLYNLYKNGFNKENLREISEERLNGFLKASGDYCAKSVQLPGAIESYPDML